jgi:NTP pyrophosphatase (non-canonical NTP hydrolase)
MLAKIKKFRDERDWKQFHNPKDLAIGLSIEASELNELFLWKDKEEVEELIKDKENLEEIKDEIADIFYYAIAIADYLKIDIEKASADKLIKAAKKYPIEKAKGKSTKYNKL